MAKKSEATKAMGQPLSPWAGRDWFWGLVLIGAIVLAYLPVWHAGYVWDDLGWIINNPNIVGFHGLRKIWTTSAADICPLTFTTFWVEHALWGAVPLPYHLVTVALHGACAIALWRVLRALRITEPGAWLGAALWALHPVEAESVAWITETKNTESGLFFLLSVLFFLRWLGGQNRTGQKGASWNYGLALFFAALAMAAKSSTVVLPVVLCLGAWWMEGRWPWRNVARVAPLFLLSLLASAVTVWTQKTQMASLANLQWFRTWPERLVTAGDAVWFYLGKLLWPHPLITVYPRWEIDAGRWTSYLPLLAVVVVLFILWLKRDSAARPWFFVFAYFLVALLPVLGLVENTIFRYSLVFDHFQYLASMGPLALAGAGLAWLFRAVARERLWLQGMAGAGVLLVLAALSWQRASAFRSEETLWTDTLGKNPACWMANSNLGTAFLNQGRTDEALVQFQEALKTNPNQGEAGMNLGNALLQKGKVDEALVLFQKALDANPNDVKARMNMSDALLQKGKVDEALALLQKALDAEPNDAEAWVKMGNALLRKGKVDEAVARYRQAVEINPDYDRAHYHLGVALAQQGQAEAAMAEFQKALRINPGYAETHYGIGGIFLQKGQLEAALAEYQKALKINPAYAEAHSGLGSIHLQRREMEAAMTEFQQALAIKPDMAEAHNNLGLAISALGRGDEAIDQYEKALAINPAYAQAHTNLAIALAQQGQLDAALPHFQEAARLNPADEVARKNLARIQAMMGTGAEKGK